MKLTPNDPRLTAYALGELDQAERAAIEAELEKSFVCQRAVEEIRETAALLEKQLAAEELPGLAFAQQRKIENRLKEPAGRNRTSFWRILFYGGVSAAAACLIASVILPGLFDSKHNSQQLALNSQPSSQTKTQAPVTEKKPPVVTTVKIAPPPPVTITTLPSAPTEPKPQQLALNTPPSFPAKPPALVHEEKKSIDIVVISAPVAPAAIATLPPTPAKEVPVSSLTPSAIQPSIGYSLTPQKTAGINWTVANAGSPASLKPNNVPGSGVGTSTVRPSDQILAGGLAVNEPNTDADGLPVSGGGGAGGGGRGSYGGSGSVTRNEILVNQNRYYRSVNGVVDGESSTKTKVPVLGDRPLTSILGNRFYRLAPGTQPDSAAYPHLTENSFLTALNHPLSTFSIDVDTASYANIRRFLNENRLPPPDAVRIEEMVNYFKYDYPQPDADGPFAANIEIAGCPWNSEHRLVRIGLKGREIARNERPPSNFVFLIDVSGSMETPERLPLIKQALRQLVKKMTENDRVAIVVYASEVGIKLQSTPCTQKEKILRAIDDLVAGGSTDGSDGIQTAYRVAQKNFIEGGVNRVLLCTDGDFNVGITDQGQLVKMIQDKAKGGVALTTLGVGTDNYKDALMQKLADKGNGNYFYLDSLEEAQKVLIDQMSGTLVTIAKDVKIQVEFNPAQVGAYRLIGYEKRMLRKEDFNNDAKDAGEIGAGHTVTALYEIVPAGAEIRSGEVDDLKYQKPAEEKPERYVSTGSKELLTLKLRYKQPDGDTSRLLEFPVMDANTSFARASTDFKFAAAVAEFGMLLRDSEFKGNSSYGTVLELAQEAKGTDAEGYRSEFLNLVRKARELQR
jgi:Ca-activated chloride channel family protein